MVMSNWETGNRASTFHIVLRAQYVWIEYGKGFSLEKNTHYSKFRLKRTRFWRNYAFQKWILSLLNSFIIFLQWIQKKKKQ